MPAKLPLQVKKLVQEVFAALDERPLSSKDNEQLAKEDPEACLVALLTKVKERLPVTGITLAFTIEEAAGEAAEAKWQAEHSPSSP